MAELPHVYIPIRTFRDAKSRLSTVLDPAGRRALATALAAHVAGIARAVGAVTTIVSSSPDVASWASALQIARLPERPGGGLNGAARVGVDHAGDDPWLILHSDLPLLGSSELASLMEAVGPGRRVLAPSYDGGTTAIGGVGPFEFTYGAASAHRHMSDGSLIVSSLGFQLDVDRPQDLESAIRHPRGLWLNEILGGGAVPGVQ